MFPPVPPEVKSISHFLKVAEDHDQRNVVVAYWARMYAIQVAMKSMPSQRPPAVTKLLVALMDWLETTKKEQHDSDGITSETAAQALIEQYALTLFQYADQSDRERRFDKKMIKAFYTSGILFDILDQFGEVSEDIFQKRKYAKWRAAYIHNCLKQGLEPTPGNVEVLFTDEDEDNYTGFLPKEEIDRIKGRLPPKEFTPPASFLFQDNPFAPPPSGGETPTSTVPQLPDVPNEPEVPVFPTVAPAVPQPVPTGNVDLSPEQIERAQKLCKLANSALTYDDVKTAIDNLQKALNLLKLGKED